MTTTPDPALAARLAPCPFCGEPPYYAERLDEDLSTHNQVVWKSVSCPNDCASFSIPDGYESGSAIDQWNTRVPADPSAAVQAAVAKAVEASDKALIDALAYIDKGHPGMARNILAAAIRARKGDAL